MNREEKRIREALVELVGSSIFKFTSMIYDEKFFGNVLVDLTSDVGINVRCIRDRGDAWCELASLKHPKELFGLYDVMAVLGIPIEPRKRDVVEAVGYALGVFENNRERITDAFGDEHYPETKSKLVELNRKNTVQFLKRVGRKH